MSIEPPRCCCDNSEYIAQEPVDSDCICIVCKCNERVFKSEENSGDKTCKCSKCINSEYDERPQRRVAEENYIKEQCMCLTGTLSQRVICDCYECTWSEKKSKKTTNYSIAPDDLPVKTFSRKSEVTPDLPIKGHSIQVEKTNTSSHCMDCICEYCKALKYRDAQTGSDRPLSNLPEKSSNNNYICNCVCTQCFFTEFQTKEYDSEFDETYCTCCKYKQQLLQSNKPQITAATTGGRTDPLPSLELPPKISCECLICGLQLQKEGSAIEDGPSSSEKETMSVGRERRPLSFSEQRASSVVGSRASAAEKRKSTVDRNRVFVADRIASLLDEEDMFIKIEPTESYSSASEAEKSKLPPSRSKASIADEKASFLDKQEMVQDDTRSSYLSEQRASSPGTKRPTLTADRRKSSIAPSRVFVPDERPLFFGEERMIETDLGAPYLSERNPSSLGGKKVSIIPCIRETKIFLGDEEAILLDKEGMIQNEETSSYLSEQRGPSLSRNRAISISENRKSSAIGSRVPAAETKTFLAEEKMFEADLEAPYLSQRKTSSVRDKRDSKRPCVCDSPICVFDKNAIFLGDEDIVEADPRVSYLSQQRVSTVSRNRAPSVVENRKSSAASSRVPAADEAPLFLGEEKMFEADLEASYFSERQPSYVRDNRLSKIPCLCGSTVRVSDKKETFFNAEGIVEVDENASQLLEQRESALGRNRAISIAEKRKASAAGSRIPAIYETPSFLEERLEADLEASYLSERSAPSEANRKISKVPSVRLNKGPTGDKKSALLDKEQLAESYARASYLSKQRVSSVGRNRATSVVENRQSSATGSRIPAAIEKSSFLDENLEASYLSDRNTPSVGDKRVSEMPCECVSTIYVCDKNAAFLTDVGMVEAEPKSPYLSEQRQPSLGRNRAISIAEKRKTSSVGSRVPGIDEKPSFLDEERTLDAVGTVRYLSEQRKSTLDGRRLTSEADKIKSSVTRNRTSTKDEDRSFLPIEEIFQVDVRPSDLSEKKPLSLSEKRMSMALKRTSVAPKTESIASTRVSLSERKASTLAEKSVAAVNITQSFLVEEEVFTPDKRLTQLSEKESEIRALSDVNRRKLSVAEKDKESTTEENRELPTDKEMSKKPCACELSKDNKCNCINCMCICHPYVDPNSTKSMDSSKPNKSSAFYEPSKPNEPIKEDCDCESYWSTTGKTTSTKEPEPLKTPMKQRLGSINASIQKTRVSVPSPPEFLCSSCKRKISQDEIDDVEYCKPGCTWKFQKVGTKRSKSEKSPIWSSNIPRKPPEKCKPLCNCLVCSKKELARKSRSTRPEDVVKKNY